jgi:hypothetical protein
MFIVTCPKCAKSLNAPDHAVGKPVRCVCGYQFVCQNPPPASTSDPAPAGNVIDGKIALPTGRSGLKSSVRVAIVLVAAALMCVVLLTATITAFLLRTKPPAVVSEAPAAPTRLAPTNPPVVKPPPATPVVAKAPDAGTEQGVAARPVQRDLLAEKESLLQDAEERLVQLRDSVAKGRKFLFIASLEQMAPDEFKGCVKEVADGATPEIVLDALKKKVEEKDRRRSGKDLNGDDKGRSLRTGKFLMTLDVLKSQLRDPNSEVSQYIDKTVKDLNMSKDLREQERLIEPLRQEVAALKAARQSAAKPAVDVAAQLKEAEQKLAALSEKFNAERQRRMDLTLQSITSPESRALKADVDNGVPEGVAIANMFSRFAEADRGLSDEEKAARLKARTERMKSDNKKMGDLIRDFKDPRSEASRKLNRELEALDSTKELRAQERLVARLREEVQVSKPAGK